MEPLVGGGRQPAPVSGREQIQTQAQRLDIAQEQYLYLTTRGRRSGQPHEIEIWFTERQGRFYVIAEYETSNWIQNLRADPHAQVRIQGRKFAALARVLGSGNDSSLDRNLIREVQELSRIKYGWGEGTVVELIPEAARALDPQTG